MNAYVYEILVDGVIRYIGKGSGVPMKRAAQHLRNARNILRDRAAGRRVWSVFADHQLSKALAASCVITLVRVRGGLSHEAAFDLERRLIKASPHGQLWNRADGGLGAGYVSEETRRRMSESAKQRGSRPEYKERCRRAWVNAPEDFKRRFIDRSQAVRSRPGYREAMAAKAKTQWADPVKARVMRAALERGRMAPHTSERHVKAWTPERREKHRERMRALWADPQFREKQTELLRNAVAS